MTSTLMTAMMGLMALSPTAEARAPVAGDIAITEIMAKPSMDRLEWFELMNATSDPLELDGCWMVEGRLDGGTWSGRSTQLPNIVAEVALSAGQRAVLAKSTSQDDDDPRYSGDTTCVGYGTASDLASSCLTGAEAIDLYSGSAFFSNSGAESLCLVCGGEPNANDTENPCEVPGTGAIIDAIEYDWDDFAGECPGGENCSIAARPAFDGDTAANDLLTVDTWCTSVTEYYDPANDGVGGATGTLTYGSPGSAAACLDPVPRCGAGQAMFTELMVAPDPGTEEWMELKGLGDECRLQGCMLERETPDGVGDYELSNVPTIASGDFVLMARTSDTTHVSMVPEVFADTAYGHNDVTMPQDEAFTMRLSCDGVVVDEVTLDWADFEDQCLVQGATASQTSCSLNVQPSVTDAASNDDGSAWCLPPADVLYENPDGGQFTGTPGADSACFEVEGGPSVGDVFFTEVMADPEDTTEWLELTNVSGGDVNLLGCTLGRHRLTEEGELDDVDTYVFGSAGEEAILSGGDGPVSRLLAKSECIEDDGDTGAPEACSFGELIYEGIDLTASNTEFLTLRCPAPGGESVLLDEIQFNLEYQGVRDGHSLIFDPNVTDPHLANDDTDVWCEAAFTQKFLELYDDSCNYGTPGETGACVVDVPEYPEGKLAFRCQAVGAGVAWWMLLGLPLVLRRRRG